MESQTHPGNSRPPSGFAAVRALIAPRRGLLVGALGLILLGRAAGLVLPVSTKFLVEALMAHRPLQSLSTILGAVLLATLVQSLSAYLVTRMLSKTSSRLIAAYRVRLQTHILRLPLGYHDANRTGASVSRIMNDVEGIRNLFGNGLIEFTGGLLTALFAFTLMLWISPKITLVAAAFLGMFGIVQRKLLGILIPTARERSRIVADVTGRLNESLAGVRVVKSYRAEERESQVFASGIERLLRNILSTTNKAALVSAVSTALIGAIAVAIMFLGARDILAGTLSLANYLTFTVLLAFLVSPVSQVVAIGTQLAEAVAGLQRSQQILGERIEDDDPRRTIAVEKARVLGHIRFDQVSFAYVANQRVVHDLSFEARPGTVTALVGSSGSGKSTIIGMICAFYAPGQGRILLDGLDLSAVQLDSYRSMLGVVLQESFLFEGTIQENIAFARPGASRGEVLEAARIAHVTEFVERLPEGFDTIVGERGIKLSGGQRQRVSIARAILADPRILILDEATSSLDSESEALIQAGLRYLIQGRTTFVIAHRLSTIHNADQILVIEDGRLLERGAHAQLYRQRGRYFDLYTRQHAVEQDLFLGPGEGDALADPVSALHAGPAAEGSRCPVL